MGGVFNYEVALIGAAKRVEYRHSGCHMEPLINRYKKHAWLSIAVQNRYLCYLIDYFVELRL